MLTAADRTKAINEVRATLLQGIGGTVILLGAYFTYRQLQTGREQLQIAQQGQVIERFTRAIDQLGHAEADVRLGGIYALERIANDSPDDRATIAEVLTAFVRGHSPWPPRLPGQYVADAPIKEVPELQVRAPDVQAALTVLARRQTSPKHSRYLDLHATDLRKAALVGANFMRADLANANLQGTDLFGALLQGAHLKRAILLGARLAFGQLQEAHLNFAFLREADLYRANLRGADLDFAWLEGADLSGAQLQGVVHLNSANLQGATLISAQLQGVNLNGVHLEGVDLYGAHLQGANLSFSQLQGANFNGVDLQEANLNFADLQGTNLSGAQLQSAQFRNADADLKTIWPEGFDPGRAGIVLIDHEWTPESKQGS
jgi:uncharacterized protein YjbI with pentapeptide repeats